MKLTHKLCGAALVAAAGVALAVPNTTKAQEHSHRGNAYIEFTRDSTRETDVTQITKPGDSTGSKATDIDSSEIQPTNPGDFGIIFVTPLNFGQHEIMNGTVTEDYFAKPFTGNANGTDKWSSPNFVKFRDDRQTLDHKYKLSVQMVSPFTGDVDGQTHTLDGATITYNNLNLASIDNATHYPTTPAFETNITIADGLGKQLAYTNVEATKGIGVYELCFGDDSTAADSVKFHLPETSLAYTSAYKSVVEWTMETVN
ncbi:WxL domain-containing protein [uncultured Enterococcus sp.]|uniref:WxL domain-containing protein n=1 Tax=uncultured Enterococcus sp. TaxID=167972 RepID=UPI002AA77545|nr:WxL domain-containing protein [uncultured Enterococcus sp.]